MIPRHSEPESPSDPPASRSMKSMKREGGSDPVENADPSAPPVPKAEERRAEPEEMGGESACQLHRFWDVED